MNGDLIVLLVACLVSAVLGLVQLIRSGWQDVDAAAITILALALAFWIVA